MTYLNCNFTLASIPSLGEKSKYEIERFKQFFLQKQFEIPKKLILKKEKKPTSPAKQFLLSKNVLDFPWSTRVENFFNAKNCFNTRYCEP